MRRCPARLTVAGLIMAIAAPAFAQTSEKSAGAESSAEAKTPWLRIARDAHDEPTGLQTCIGRFAKLEDGRVKYTLDLIAAVHVGERNYYKKLNELFSEYDVVLYELVAPEGVRPKKNRVQASNNPLSMMHGATQSLLGLESQLDLVDYSKRNFVHADMSPEQIRQRMQERGDTGFTVMWAAIADVMREANRQQLSSDVVNPLELLLSLDDEVKLKRLLAEQFVVQGVLESGLGPTLNRMLISDRNVAALKILDREVDNGHRRLAIFYGAGHMPDFQRRLQDGYKMMLVDRKWLTAWNLSRKTAAPEDPLLLLLRLFGEASRSQPAAAGDAE